MQKTSIEYGQTKFKTLLDRIKNGEIKIPPFQRTFDWSPKDMARFYNSIVNGEPFGSIMLWIDTSNNSELKQTNLYFNALSKKQSSKTNKTFLIDGQQRLTTFAILYLLHNKDVYNIKIRLRYEKIYFDLKNRKFYSGKKRETSFLAHYFFEEEFKAIRKKISSDFSKILEENKIIDDRYEIQDLLEDVNNIYNKFNDVSIGKVEVLSTNLDDVINIFTLINTKGKRLTPFNIAHANFVSKNFDLDEKFSKIIEKFKKEKYEFTKSQLLILAYSVMKETISNAEILKCSYNISKEDIEYIDKHFENDVMSMVHASKKVLNFPSSDFVPSGNILNILINILKDNYRMSSAARDILRKWVKLAIINERYVSGSEGIKQTGFENDINLLREALYQNKNIDEIENKNKPWINDGEFTADSIIYENYGSGSATYKYMISKMIEKIPSITTGNIVEKGDFNKMKDLNIHHIFPKGNTNFKDNNLINSIANLTPLEKDDNIDIGNESPNSYIKNKIKENKISAKYLEKALINIEKLDDYDIFVKDRAEKIVDFLNKDN